MASQVLTGQSNLTYTNSSEQNVRLVINFLSVSNATMTWSGTYGTVNLTIPAATIGKDIAYAAKGSTDGSYSQRTGTIGQDVPGLPTELALSTGDTFAISGFFDHDTGGYNIVVIPEAG
tara:strand:- start:30 stop:386 length:357 start_codon:yes stop_codon:yes gene_type:complete